MITFCRVWVWAWVYFWKRSLALEGGAVAVRAVSRCGCVFKLRPCRRARAVELVELAKAYWQHIIGASAHDNVAGKVRRKIAKSDQRR